MPTYAVEQLDTVVVSKGSPIDGMDLMSPFVWKEGAIYRAMIRGVPDPLGPTGPTGIVAGGTSTDGLNFMLDEKLAIMPTLGSDDAGGCEDPTVLTTGDGYLVYYTGVDAERKQGCMILASGRNLATLEKRDVVLKAPPGEGNFKEATLARSLAGDWRLFYEYAAKDASRVGWASGPGPEGGSVRARGVISRCR